VSPQSRAGAWPCVRRLGDRGRSIERPRERRQEQVVVLAVADVEADPVRVHTDDDPRTQERLSERLGIVDRDEQEVGRGRKRLQAQRDEGSRAAVALLHLRRDARRSGESQECKRRRDARDGLRRLPPVQLRGCRCVRERVPDTRTGEPERLRERTDDDHAVLDEADRGLARELVIGLVDDERSGCGQLAELPCRVVGAAAERHDRIQVADLGARQVRRDAIDRIRPLVGDRDDVAGTGKRSGAEQDEVVGARPEDDVLRRDPGITRDPSDERGKASVRIGVHLGERGRDRSRPCERSGLGGDVPVEAHDLRRVELVRPRDLLRRGRPRILGEARREGSHRRTAAACAGMPSTAASASTVGRIAARPLSVRRWIVTGLRKVSRPMPPTARAQPPVGST